MATTDNSELARVLAALDDVSLSKPSVLLARADAVRLLRAAAKIIDEYADHGLAENGKSCPLGSPRTETLYGKRPACTCGLDAAREKWRL